MHVDCNHFLSQTVLLFLFLCNELLMTYCSILEKKVKYTKKGVVRWASLFYLIIIGNSFDIINRQTKKIIKKNNARQIMTKITEIRERNIHTRELITP